MAIVKIEEIAAYDDDEKTYCPDCVEDVTGLIPIIRDHITDDEVVVCDVCGKIL